MVQVVKKSKGEQTRAVILETALRLFRERGYEETTMRAIAEEADVALGNTYYYFGSKEDLVQAFYERLQEQQIASCAGILETERSLKGRLTGVLRAHFAVVSPYQRMFVSLFIIAADPSSPLNPFHPATSDVRDKCIGRFGQVLDCQENIAADIKRELPYLLWLYHMSLVLFWIYDRTPGYVRTYKLIELSADLISNLINLASMPVMMPFRKMLLQFLANVRSI